MQLRWTWEAAADLERIADYLFQHVPERAAELVRAVYDAPALLLEFPHRGRPGKKAGTRELVISPLPYLVVYTVHGDVVYVVRILHGAQQWP
jgi:toxin ParE1/3/4